MSAKSTPTRLAAGTAVLGPDDVKTLIQSVRTAAEALRDLEGKLALIAPQNAMRAEKFAEECEATASAIANGDLRLDAPPSNP